MQPLAQDPLEASLIERAEKQWGLLRPADLAEFGFARGAMRHRLKTGRLHELHPGVYALGHRAITRKAEFLAATWWCGGDAALADESACAFYRWVNEDVDHPPPIHVTTTKIKRSRPGIVVHQTRRLPREDVITFEQLLRVTDEARTLIDRADRLAYPDLRLLADQLRFLPKEQLEAKHARLPGRAGWARTELLIHSEDARAKSALERRFTTYARRHAIRPPDARNAVVAGCQADCVWRAERLVVELDSRAHHQRRREMAEDRRRDRRYRMAGWTPIRLVWEELEPDDFTVARELRQLLG